MLEIKGIQKDAYDPRHFVVKLYRPNIVKVTMQGKKTTSTLRANVYTPKIKEGGP